MKTYPTVMRGSGNDALGIISEMAATASGITEADADAEVARKAARVEHDRKIAESARGFCTRCVFPFLEPVIDE